LAKCLKEKIKLSVACVCDFSALSDSFTYIFAVSIGGKDAVAELDFEPQLSIDFYF
jgi:hypothetical protein